MLFLSPPRRWSARSRPMALPTYGRGRLRLPSAPPYGWSCALSPWRNGWGARCPRRPPRALRLDLHPLPVAHGLVAELPEPPPPGTGLARLREARLHVIGAEEALRALPSGSAVDTRWDALRQLRDLGRGTAGRWLDDNLAAIGTRPTLDLTRFARPTVEIQVEG